MSEREGKDHVRDAELLKCYTACQLRLCAVMPQVVVSSMLFLANCR